jgi:hypothetical protein
LFAGGWHCTILAGVAIVKFPVKVPPVEGTPPPPPPPEDSPAAIKRATGSNILKFVPDIFLLTIFYMVKLTGQFNQLL